MPWIGALAVVFALAAPQDAADEGLKALEAGNPAAAEVSLREAVQANPNDYSLHFNLSLALSLQNKDVEAEAELRRTLQIEPGLYQAEMNLGILLLRDKRAADALIPLKAAAEAKPGEVRPNLLYGEALLTAGDAAGAVERYRAAAESDPKSGAAQLGWARALMKTTPARLAEAEAHFRKAGELDPQNRATLLELAVAYDRAGRADEAIALYREFPESAESKNRLAALLLQKDDFAAAIPGLEQTLKSAPTVENRLALAEAYRLNHQADRAAEQLQQVVAADPGNYDLRMRLGRVLRDQRKLAPAANEFLAAAKIRPDAVEAWNELASALIVGENYQQGLVALDRVRALGKEIAGDLYYRALCLDKLRQLKPALAAYQQFLAAAGGKFPDQEFVARQRARIIDTELKKR